MVEDVEVFEKIKRKYLFPKEAVSILGEDPCRIALNVIRDSIIREKNANTPGTIS